MTRPPILDRDDVAVVPREATIEMECSVDHEDCTTPDAAKSAFKAMLSASPHSSAWQEVREYVAGMERERDAFSGVLEGAEYGYIEDIAKYDAEKAKALGRMVGRLSKALLTRTETAEARIAALELRLAEAERVIEPFASVVDRAESAAAHFEHDHVAEVPDDRKHGHMGLTWGHLRAARAWKEWK